MLYRDVFHDGKAQAASRLSVDIATVKTVENMLVLTFGNTWSGIIDLESMPRVGVVVQRD